jgi:hypothetical protein
MTDDEMEAWKWEVIGLRVDYLQREEGYSNASAWELAEAEYNEGMEQ